MEKIFHFRHEVKTSHTGLDQLTNLVWSKVFSLWRILRYFLQQKRNITTRHQKKRNLHVQGYQKTTIATLRDHPTFSIKHNFETTWARELWLDSNIRPWRIDHMPIGAFCYSVSLSSRSPIPASSTNMHSLSLPLGS